MKEYLILMLIAGLSVGANAASFKMDLDAEAYEKEYKSGLEQAESLFRKLEKLEGPKTVDNVLNPLNDLGTLLDNIGGKASLFYHTHPDEKTRETAKLCQQELSKLSTEISLSRPIYDACLEVDVSKEDAATQRNHKHLLRDLRRSGVNKTKETRDKIKKLQEELIQLGQDFSKNISTDIRSIELDSVKELDGLPKDYIEAHKPNDKGKIVITTDYPDYIPFATYAHDDSLRFEFYKKFRNRGYPANKKVLESILEKRYEMAKLLGYKNYAEYVTETKMIKSAGNAKSFIKKISKVADKRAGEDYQVLLKRLQKIYPDAKEVGDWQKTYITELVKREQYKVDSKDLREYFQYGKVRDGIIEMTCTLFGVEIVKSNAKVWHEAITPYQVKENGKVIAEFYLDMHPRENKYKHAAHFGLRSGIAGKQVPASVLVCNFPGKTDETELMQHDQVLTFLHEFGHMIHHMLGGNHKWIAFSGIATEWDFVEAPSQMLEEWLWNYDVLKKFAVNKEGKTIPEELVKKSVAAKDFAAGLWVKHQMFYASLSLNIYNSKPNKIDLDKDIKRLQNKFSPYKHVDETYMYANFGHLYGYSAIYYTYMWSQVIAKDLFSRFESEGLMNTKTALEYRKAVLEPGGSRDAADMVEDFLGRPYNFDAYANWLNKK